jgi:glycosyltransferase involved in cell wall biosynthesis
MKVLLSAYACAPGMGSEPEVGLQALLGALTRHEVWVLTQPHMAQLLAPLLADLGLSDRAHVVAVGPRAPEGQAGLTALARTQVSHERWQRAAATAALSLHAEVHFDVVHHVTLAAYWMRTGVAVVGAPLVWGPVGGALEPPLGLLSVLGARGLAEDAVRTAARLGSWALPSRRSVATRAEVVLAQNAATARRLRRAGDVRILSNATAAALASAPEAGPRRRDIAVVGRVVAWKAVPLAVRALGHLPADVPLHVYGECGAGERARVDAAARRAGVEERVHLHGKVPREQVLARVASSGVLLLPSLHDEASVTVAEALALGTPVVALDHGGPPQVVAAFGGADRVRLVRPTTPARTARALGAAVSELLGELAPVGAHALVPEQDFRAELLDAYERAVATGTGGLRRMPTTKRGLFRR